MEQQIGFATRPDGARVAYSVVGEGPPLVMFGPGHHLQQTWADPKCRAFYEALARRHTLIRLDVLGLGLSDERSDFSVNSDVTDLQAVVDHLRLDRFALFGCAGGHAPAAISYAADHPSRLTHLILFAACAHGESVGTKDVRESAVALLRSNPRLGRKVFADVIASGDADCERFCETIDYPDPETHARMFECLYETDVRDALSKIVTPTLVLHRKGDRATPFACGREVAAGINGARFVPLEGRTARPEFGDTGPMLEAIAEFLAAHAEESIATGASEVRDDIIRDRSAPTRRSSTEQQIGFATRPDGVRIAYAVVGQGPPLVKVGPWGHLERTWEQPQCRAFYESLTRSHTLIRLDKHGTGMSDRDRTDFTVASEVADLAAVVDHLALERFTLLGCTGESPMAIAYAAEHPERVEKLVLFAPFAHGERVGTKEVRESGVALIRNNYRLGVKVFADIMASGDERCEQFMISMIEEPPQIATAETFAHLFELVYESDVRDALPKIAAPTLVLHREGDRAIPFALGREVAAGIKGARFVRLEGRTNWPEFGDAGPTLDAIHEFLGTTPAALPTSVLYRDRYEPIEVVGSGGQGEVVRALDQQHERQVALKVRPIGDPDARRSLLSEARVLLGLRPHAGLPLVRDDFFADDRYVIVMDWVEGTDLRTLLDRQGDPGLPVGSVLAYLADVAEALDHLHTHEPPIVHGDVKPANMILTPQGKVVLVDFGIASGSGDKQMGSGTRGYVAPEVAAGQGSTPAADIFGLAATAFALLTGKNPEGEWPEWEGFAPSQARSLGRAIRLGMSTDPARRPRRASELIERLRAWQQSTLPTGTVTFLMTDVEGSTPLWDEHPEAMPRVLARHEHLIADAVESNNGRFIKSRGEGDSTLSVFVKASDAVAAAIAMQRALHAERWPEGIALRVRAALHTGEAELREGDYYGPTVNRAARIRALATGGEIVLSQATSQLVSDWVPSDATLLDRGIHELKGLGRSEHVFGLMLPDLHDPEVLRAAQSDADREAEFARLTAKGLVTLPPKLTSFVGRTNDLVRAREAVHRERFVTLVGPGGVGKTRLAVETARELIGSFADGVHLVDLASIGTGQQISGPVAGVLGLDPAAGMSGDAIGKAIGPRDVLLVLDNCEHVLEEARDCATALTEAAAGVHVLATSRAPLGARGETVIEIRPLDLPEQTDDAQAVAGSGAVRLFSDRASLVRPGFEVGAANAAVVATICRRLDGMPLAIELAAARAGAMSLTELDERLSARLPDAAPGGRAQRHRTLEATIDWSYDLLGSRQAECFRACGVFEGAFTPTDAEAVCPRNRQRDLESLSERSLIAAEPLGGEVRYRMLETIKRYARERAEGADEWNELIARYVEHYSTLIPKLDRLPDRAASEDALALVAVDARVALERALAVGRIDDAVSIASSIWGLWLKKGPLSFGRVLLEQTAQAARDARMTGEPVEDVIDALATIVQNQAEHAYAERLWREALEMATVRGDGRQRAIFLINLAGTAGMAGRPDDEAMLVRQALEAAEASGQDFVAARANLMLGHDAGVRGELDEARPLLERSVELFTKIGHPTGTIRATVELALLGLPERPTPDWRARCERALGLCRQMDDRLTEGMVLTQMGISLLGTGELADAVTTLKEAIELTRGVGNERSMLNAIEHLACVDAESGDAHRAVTLFAAVDALRSSRSIEPKFTEFVEEVRTRAETRAGGATARAHAEGAALSLDDAADIALSIDTPAPAPAAQRKRAGVAEQARQLIRIPFPNSLQPRDALPFVGREAERSALEHAWNSGDPSLRSVLIAGEPGAGKTRLVAEFAHVAHADGAIVLFGRCDDGLAMPFQPLVEALKHYATGSAEPSFGPLAPELIRLVPELSDRIDGEPLSADPETEQYRLFEAVREWLEAASADTPIVLVLDDLQWATRPTLLMLRHVLQSASGRFLIVGTYRDTEPGPLGELLSDLTRVRGTRIALGGLQESEIAQLVEDDAQAASIHAATAGNAFFVGEIVRHHADRDSLPVGARDAVAQRLARLPETTRETLHLAAVAGEEFEFRVIVHCLPDAQRSIEEAVRTHLVQEVPGRGLRYRFVHALVRSVIEDELTTAGRARLHQQIGEAIEVVHRDELDAHVPSLARHFDGAVDLVGHEKAFTSVVRAGEQALARYANEDAATFFERALELRSDFSRTDVIDVAIALGEAQRRAGSKSYRETLVQAAQAAQRLRDHDRLARAVIAADPHFVPLAGADRERAAVIRSAMEALGPEDSEARARLMADLGLALVHDRDQDTSHELSAAALAMAQRIGDLETIGHVLRARIHVLWSARGLDDCLEAIRQLESIAEKADAPTLRGFANLHGMYMFMQRGDIRASERCLAASEAIAHDLRQPLFRGAALTWRASRALARGRFDESEALLTEAFRIRESYGQEDAFLFYSGQVFQLRFEQGRLDELRPVIEDLSSRDDALPLTRATAAVGYSELGLGLEARAIIDTFSGDDIAAVPENQFWHSTMTSLAIVASRHGPQTTVAKIFDLLAPYADQHDVNIAWWRGSMHHYLAVLGTALGAYEDAEVDFALALEIHERVRSPNWTARTKIEWAELLRLRGHPEDLIRARDLAAQALATADHLGMARVASQARALLEAPLPA